MEVQDIFDYYDASIRTECTALYENEYLDNDLSDKLVIINNEDVLTDKRPMDLNKDKIYIIIYYNGGNLNTDTPMEIYNKIFNIEIIAEEKYRSDVTVLLNDIAVTNRNLLFTLADTPIQVNVQNDPIMDQKITIQGHDAFKSYLTLFILIYNDGVLGNDVILKINNVEIPKTKMVKSRVFENRADLQKREASKHFTNTSTFQLKVEGTFDKSNTTLVTLFDALDKNTSFGTTWSITTERSGSIKVNDIFSLVEITDETVHNQLIKYSMTFITAMEV